MIVMQSGLHVDRISGAEIFEFLTHPTDDNYQRWWPGTHLRLHILKHGSNGIGDVIYMDELIGKRRVKMQAIVTEARTGKQITWQLKKFIRLPAWLSLDLEDDAGGVTITHTIRAGFKGIGRIVDPILRAFLFSDEFERAMDEHVKTEFPKLRDMLCS